MTCGTVCVHWGLGASFRGGNGHGTGTTESVPTPGSTWSVLGSHPKDRQGPKPTLKFVHGLLVPGCALGRMVVEPTATCCPAWTALAACVHRVGGQGMQHVVRKCTFLGYLGAVAAWWLVIVTITAARGCLLMYTVLTTMAWCNMCRLPLLHICECNWV